MKKHDNKRRCRSKTRFSQKTKNASPVFSRVSTVLIWQEIVVQNEATHAKCYILMLRWLLYSGFTQNIANYGGFWALFDQKLGSRNENWIQHKTRVISGISFSRIITNALVYRILKFLNKNIDFSVPKESEKLLSQKKQNKRFRAPRRCTYQLNCSDGKLAIC